MFKILFPAFIIMPIIEIAILLQVSDVIGGWSTILLVILTAYFGAKMVKAQGLQTIAQIQTKTAQGQIPGEELFNGVCILISGVLLLTPGIVTDVIGFLLLTPAIRRQMVKVLKNKIHIFAAGAAGGQSSMFTFTQQSQDSQDFYQQERQGETFEYQFTQEQDSFKRPEDSEQNDAIEPPKNVIDGEFTRKE